MAHFTLRNELPSPRGLPFWRRSHGRRWRRNLNRGSFAGAGIETRRDQFVSQFQELRRARSTAMFLYHGLGDFQRGRQIFLQVISEPIHDDSLVGPHQNKEDLLAGEFGKRGKQRRRLLQLCAREYALEFLRFTFKPKSSVETAL